MGRIFASVACLAVFVAAATTAAADEVLLKNGHVFQGKIIFIDQDKVTIRIQLGGQNSYVDMTFDRAKVQDIKYDSTVFKPLVPTAAEEEEKAEEKPEEPAKAAAPEGAQEPEAAKTTPAAEGSDADKEEEIDPALKAQIAALIKELDTADVQAKGEAENKLLALGRNAVPFLAAALRNPSLEQRFSCIWLLHRLGDKRSVKALLGALKGEGATEDQRRCLSAAADALRAITGQTLPFTEGASVDERSQQVAAWERWFESVKDSAEYKIQVGVAKATKAEEAAKTEQPEAKAEAAKEE